MGSVAQIAAGRHVYALRTVQRVAYLCFSVAFGALATLFFNQSVGDLHPAEIMLGAGAFAAASVYLALAGLRSRLVIDGGRVQIRGALQTREFDLNDVEGTRTFRGRYQSYQVICLKDKTWKITLTKYAADAALNEWIAELKDLDKQDREQLLEKIDRDEELGATPEERRSALKRAKQINIAAWIVDAGAAAAFAIGPAQYRLTAMLALALAPAVAAYLLYRRPLFYGLFKPKADPRGDVSPLLIISGFGLLIGASRVNFVSTSLLLPFIGTGTLASLAMFYPTARKNTRLAGALAGLCVLSGLYGWGLAASADTAVDRSVPEIYTAQVLDGHVSRSSRSTSYYLELGPWGPYADVDTQMEVSPRVYYATGRGQIICLALHAGTLRVPWYEPVACAKGSQ